MLSKTKNSKNPAARIAYSIFYTTPSCGRDRGTVNLRLPSRLLRRLHQRFDQEPYVKTWYVPAKVGDGHMKGALESRAHQFLASESQGYLSHREI